MNDIHKDYALLIPHYNHYPQLQAFLPQLQSSGLVCIIIDDGSDADTLTALQQQLATLDNTHLISHGYNRGKGAAIKTGMVYARSAGFRYVIQIDADGQHAIDDVHTMIHHSQQQPHTIISGQPYFDDSAPKARVYGRKVSDIFAAVETLSLTIKDCLCGFRIYPLTETETIVDSYYIGNRMDVDTELLVKACWLGIDVMFVKTKVIYPVANISHFHYWRDNIRLIRLHSRLMWGAVWRLPKLLLLLIKRHRLIPTNAQQPTRREQP